MGRSPTLGKIRPEGQGEGQRPKPTCARFEKLNLNLGWAIGDLRVGASVMNLLDAAGSDIEYFYASRLPGEAMGGIQDVHFHPVEPRQLRIAASWGL